MHASLWPLTAPVRRCARRPLLTNPLPAACQRPWARIGNSLLARDYNSSRDPPQQQVVHWSDAKTRELVEYIDCEFLSRNRTITWDMVSGHTGLSVKQCKAKYNSALAENYKKTGGKRNEAAVSAVYMTKLCYEFPRNAKAVERNWTPEEIRLLRMARGASKRCDSWERVAAFVGNGRTKQDCMEVWKVGCHKALELAALRVEAKNRIELKKATEIKEHWTPQELTRLRTLLDSKSSTNAAKMDAAVAMFPEKSKSKVCTMVKYLRHDARQQKLKQTEGLEEDPAAKIHCEQKNKIKKLGCGGSW